MSGQIETRAIEKLDETLKEHCRARSLLMRLGRPEDIANAALFLCSREADCIAGHRLPVSGGMAASL